MDRYDGIVIGAGHNGLVLAAYMARAGLRVAVLERNPDIGGGCITREVTLPGFRHNTHANFLVGWDLAPPFYDLELYKHGLGLIFPPVQVGVAFRDGTALTVHRDLERTCQSIARFSERDARTYRELYRKFAEGARDTITYLLYSPPLPSEELGPRLKEAGLGELAQYSSLTISQAVEQHFEDEHVRVMFKLFLHAYTLEDIPGAGFFFPRIFSRIDRLALAVGGTANLSLALARAVRAYGGTILTGAHVRRIVVRDNRAVGVELADGTVLAADRFVASSADFPQTVQMAGEGSFDADIVDKAHRWQWAGHALVVLHLALRVPPHYRSAAFDPDIDQAFNLFIGGDTSEEIRSCFDDIHRGRFPTYPMGNGACNTIFDPTYAPGGGHTAFWWPFVPYELEDADWDDEGTKREVTERLLEVWRQYAPNLDSSNVLASYLHTPKDTARDVITMVRGSHQIGAYTLDQWGYMRPHPALSHYRTPVEGLYLCGSTSHPGGSVTGGPGYNAANVIARDLGLQPWWRPLTPPWQH